MQSNYFHTQALYKNYSPMRNSKSDLRASSKHKSQMATQHKEQKSHRIKNEQTTKESYLNTSRPKTKKNSKNSGLFDFLKSSTSDNNIPKTSHKNSQKLLPPLSMPRSISPNLTNRKRSVSNMKNQEKINEIKDALKHYKGKSQSTSDFKFTTFCIFDVAKPSKYVFKLRKILQPGFCQKCKKELKKEGLELESIPEEFIHIKKPDNPERIEYYNLIEAQKNKIMSLRKERKQKINENKNLVNKYQKNIEIFFSNLHEILDQKKNQITEQFELSCLQNNNYYVVVENLINRNIQDLIKLQKSLRDSKDSDNQQIEKNISYHSELAKTYQFQQVQDPISVNKTKFTKEFQNHFDSLWESCYKKPIENDNILQQLEKDFQMCPPNESQLEEEIQYKDEIEQERRKQSTSNMQPLVDYILNDQPKKNDEPVFKKGQEDSIISSIYDQSQNQSLVEYQAQFKKIQEDKLKKQIQAQNLGGNFQRKMKKQEDKIENEIPEDSLLQMYKIIPD